MYPPQPKFILLEKHKFIFFAIPKNGCSSMKAQIIEVLGLEKGSHYPKDVHDRDVYVYPEVSQETLSTQYQDYLRICIARNPWDRLVSCFRDKIRPAGFNAKGYVNGVAIPLMNTPFPFFYGGMPFDEFVDVVCSIPDLVAEHHFQSQLYQITDDDGNLMVNYIGHLETLEENLKEISIKTDFPISQYPHVRKIERKPYQEYYSKKTAGKVKQRFAADIEFFGYEFNQANPIKQFGFLDDSLKEKLTNSKSVLSVLKEKNQHRISVLENQVKQQNKRIENMENSVSWKITAPFRRIAAALGVSKE